MSKKKGPVRGAFFCLLLMQIHQDRTQGLEDILHYQKIIVVQMETSRLMGEIDRIEIE